MSRTSERNYIIMKITFLGTSHGIPEKGRFTSGIAVEVGENLFIIDAGAPVCSLLIDRGIDLHRLKAVFITHRHGDHNNGLPELVDELTWPERYKDCDPTLFFPEAGAIPLLKAWVEYCSGQRVHTRMETYSDGVVYKDDKLTVTALRTKHTDASFGFCFSAEGKTVLFTGDMSTDYPEYPALTGGRHFDAVVCEGAHLNSETPIVQYLNTDTEKLVVTHVYPPKLPLLEGLKGSERFAVTFANDGTVITV